jgi:tetratricopeptide (TPR) repeat protein
LAEGVMSRCPTVKQELASELALHFEEGRDYHQATHCFMLAAENAVRRFAHREAIKVLRHALQLTSFVDSGSRTEFQIQILQRIGDSHYALGSLSDAASAYETAATTAAQTGRRAAQLEALARLSVPAGYLDPERGKDVCEQAVAVSRQHGDPLRVAQSQLAAACFRVVYDAGRNEDAEACVSARRQIERLTSAAVPEDVFYAYVRAIQGHCEEALRMAEGATTATSNPAAQLVAAGAKILTMITWGRFGEALRMVRSARELAQNNDEDPWMFIITEAWLRARCFDFDGVRNLTTIIMRNDAEEHALQPRVIAMLSAGYAELHRNRCADALHYFEQVCDETVTPRFFLHWHWRMHARLGICEARLQAGDLENARLEIDTFLDSALFMADPNFRVLAWEAKARVALIQGDLPSAAEFIESALGILDAFDIPVVAWRVHATGWELYGRAGQIEKAEGHRARAADVIMRLADSFEEGESLRESLLNAVPIRRIFEHAMSA